MNTQHWGITICLLLLCACEQDSLQTAHPPSTAETVVEDIATTPVTPNEALDVANNFLGRQSAVTRNRSDDATSIETMSKEDGNALIFVVNYKGGGYALVSASTDYYPVIAYSETGSFNTNSSAMPPSLISWLNEQKGIISGSVQIEDSIKQKCRQLWAIQRAKMQASASPQRVATTDPKAEGAFRQRIHELGSMGYRAIPLTQAKNILPANSSTYNDFVSKAEQLRSPLEYTIFAFKQTNQNYETGPLVTTEWGQRYPYNALCKASPYSDPAGCMTIAMAQIMHMFKHPSNYIWSNMPDTGATTDTQVLIRDIASALGIDFYSNYSGVYVNRAIATFRNKFQYNVVKKDYNSGQMIAAVSRGELVLVVGSDPNKNEAHAWICDGARSSSSQTDYFVEYITESYTYGNEGWPSLETPWGIYNTYGTFVHFNWGWNGDGNSWYAPTSAKPVDDHGNDYGYDFYKNKEALYITPNK